jgi:REP element-mobilizing transposase RayT
MAELHTYRRNLPHWRLSGATYFVTWRLLRALPELTAAERTIVAEAIRRFDGQKYGLEAYVVMNDHVHVVLAPLGDVRLQDVVAAWKSYTTHRLQREHGRPGAVWQEEYFDRIVRDEAELAEKMNYVVNNPVRRWPDVTDYSWVWARGFAAPEGAGN